jgi:hypothetical protein
MPHRINFLLFFILFLANQNFAQLSDFEFGGYQKYLFGTSKYPGIDSRLNDHLLHTRLNFRYYPSQNIITALELRFRAYYGGSVEKIPNYSDLIQTKRDFVDLDWLMWNSKSSLGYLEVDRFYFDWNLNKLQLTLGRQRIAWGTSWVWNPTDIFNPLNVLDFDYEELPATDAVRLQYYTGAVSKLEIAYKPAKNNRDQILAGLWSINKWNYDFNVIAGMRFKRWLAGFSWAGDIFDAGFRGEILVSDKTNPSENPNQLIPVNNSIYNFDHTIVSASLSGDYTFENSFYIHTEVLFNNNGKTKNAFLFQQESSSLVMLSAARWSLYQEFAYDITPLIRGTLFGIYNPSDHSFIVVPSVSYSVITNLDLFVNTFFFKGDPLTEFGEYGTAAYIRLKYSF